MSTDSTKDEVANHLQLASASAKYHLGHAADAAAAGAKETVADVKDKLQDRAAIVEAAARQAADDVRRRLSLAGEHVSVAGDIAADTVSDGVRHLNAWLVHETRSSPVKTLAIAALVGFVFGKLTSR